MPKKLKDQNKIALLNILSTIILQGLAFFSSPYFSRTLGAANYGIVSVFNTWVQVITIVYFVRMNGAIVMGMTEYSDEEQAGYQSSIFALALFVFMGFSVLTLMIVSAVNPTNLWLVVMMLLQAFGMFCVTFANSKFTYEFRADLNFIMSVGISITTIIFSVLLIKEFSAESNYWGRIYGVTIPYVVSGIIIAVFIFYKGREVISFKYWTYALPLAIPMVFHSISVIILNQSDRVMLKYIQSNSIAGIYSLAYTFSNVINVCWSALNNTWVPIYYDNTKAKKVDVIKHQTKNYLELFTVLCIGFMLLTPEVYSIFASEEYRLYTSLIPVFVIGYYFIFLYSFPVNYEIYYKKTRIIAIGSTAAALINICLNVVLIKSWGAYGAALATFISYMLQFVFHYYVAKHVIKEGECPFTFNIFIPYIVVVFAFGFISVSWAVWYFRWILAMLIGLFEGIRLLKRRTVF